MSTDTSNNRSDFGAKLKELEAITEWFESEEVDLDQALAKFERGMQLATELQRELGEVENRVEAIKTRFSGAAAEAAAADGEPPASSDEAVGDDTGPTLFS